MMFLFDTDCHMPEFSLRISRHSEGLSLMAILRIREINPPRFEIVATAM